jgi:hypothetical protein
MKRAVTCGLGMAFAVFGLMPAAPASAQANGGPAAFAEGVKGMLTLSYDGMSRESLSKATSWPLAKTFQTWPYDGRRYSGDVYLYPGSDAAGKFSLTYDEVEVGQQRHVLVRALTTRDPLPEGNDCLRVRDLRAYAAGAGWTDIQTYAAMLTHGFTARKGALSLDVRVDVGMGQASVPPAGLDDEGCVGAVTIRDVTAG